MMSWQDSTYIQLFKLRECWISIGYDQESWQNMAANKFLCETMARSDRFINAETTIERSMYYAIREFNSPKKQDDERKPKRVIIYPQN
jgi:hypothetical protein